MSQASLTPSPSLEVDEGYDQLEAAIRNRIGGLAEQLYTTNATPDNLWNTFLDGLPPARRQHYNCNACRRFIQRYGGLVTIDEQGQRASAIWEVFTREFFFPSIASLQRLVRGSEVIGVFLSSESTWGTPRTGSWSHLSGHILPPNSPLIYKDPVKSASQAMAEKLEDFTMLSRGLAEYPKPIVDQALRVLRADALARSEKALGVAEWLGKLHDDMANTSTHARNNLVWRAVALAPPGFAHIRATIISTLLDDIKDKYSYDVIAKRWAQKMHPLKYQRPTATPAPGNIDQAEKLVEKLGISRSLLRRFARLEDVQKTVWATPRTDHPRWSPGVFDHLRQAKRAVGSGPQFPTTPITWTKFERTVLSDALEIEILVPGQAANFYGLVTAVDPTAPAIIQWDGLEGYPRNPVSYYFYPKGSAASDWGLGRGWGKVNTIFLSPHQWQEPHKFKHHTTGVLFAIEGAHDMSRPGWAGLGLFPEILRSELHGVRSVIEAHSNKGHISDPSRGTANGLAFFNGHSVTVRVGTVGGLATYLIDRFD